VREELTDKVARGGLVRKTAILVDGGFFVKRICCLTGDKNMTAHNMANHLYKGVLHHLKLQHRPLESLYRIFFYDSSPPDKTIWNPVSKSAINYQMLSGTVTRLELHERLRSKRKVALRLGELQIGSDWTIRPHMAKKIVNGSKTVADLEAWDIKHPITQKGVDIKIGLDIASLSYQGNVDQIILISGDSDFVPAAKLARRSGIDFILDPMWNHIKEGLNEHIDGMQSPWPRPTKS
jgi:uncharacterized LabA/DUF88 family protein